MDIILVALGGNALKGGHDLQHFPELEQACNALTKLQACALVITHGNGPQIGNLALNEALYGAHHEKFHESSETNVGLDVLGAETEGILGYQIEQELSNKLDTSRLVSILTRVKVDAHDESFNKPSKPIGPYLPENVARELTAKYNWQFIQSGKRFKRVVASPLPEKVLQAEAVKVLLEANYIVICAGGGGIPVIKNRNGIIQGVEAVIDKDFTSSLLAQQLDAKKMYLITDVDGIYRHWNTPEQELLESVTTEQLQTMNFPEGSMGPKVKAACDFVDNTGGTASIGSLKNMQEIFAGRSGTWISNAKKGTV